MRWTLLLTSMWILDTSASAHEWYDKACCSQKDCAPVIGTPKRIDAHNIQATTKHGTAIFTRNKWKISKDCQYHACMNTSAFLKNYGAQGICLYIPTCS